MRGHLLRHPLRPRSGDSWDSEDVSPSSQVKRDYFSLFSLIAGRAGIIPAISTISTRTHDFAPTGQAAPWR